MSLLVTRLTPLIRDTIKVPIDGLPTKASGDTRTSYTLGWPVYPIYTNRNIWGTFEAEILKIISDIQLIDFIFSIIVSLSISAEYCIFFMYLRVL